MTFFSGIDQISVIELDFHHDSLDGFLKIFKDTSIKIDVFTTTKNVLFLKSIQYSDNITFYEYSGGWKYLFLKKHSVILNSSQIIFINTIANDFGAYMFIDNQAKIILRVHNVNKQFKPLRSIFFPKSVFFAWKFFSYVIRQIIGKGFLIFRPIINKKVDYFTFPDNGIVDFVKQNRLVNENKIIPCIPLKIFVEADTAYEGYSDILNVTIIGATDMRRRQYEEVTEALKQLYKNEHAPAIHLTLLGNTNNAYGKSIIDQLNRITNPGFKLKTYNKQVPEPEFIDCIKHTHLIISPITNNATTDIFKETYGKTKTTGSILDFLKFGKITLVPAYYTPPVELSDYIIKYNNSENLEKIILDLLQDKKINSLNQRSLEYVRKNYSQGPVLRKTIAIFTSVINHGQIAK